MSAWIVEKGHIDCLVQAMIAEDIVTMDRATDVGRVLWHENHLSIEARYGDEPNTPEYTFRGIEAPLDDLIVWRQLACYSYQTCEHARWGDPSTPARSFHDALEMVYKLRYDCESSHELERRTAAEQGVRLDLPWGITDIEEAIKR